MSNGAKKVVADSTLRGNLHGILREFDSIMKPSVEISKDRDILVDDLSALIRRLPMNNEQVKKLYDAITARMESKTCYKCARLKPVLGGGYTYPGNDMSKPKRFICKECNV
jgi:hypothetical protein